MKKITIILVAAVFFMSCNNPSQSNEEGTTVAGSYGDTEWDTHEAITGSELLEQLANKDSVYTTLAGNIKAACQAKGCWMNVDVAGNEMFVKFKDYGFFVPKNSGDHDAIIKGWAYVDTISVKDRLEYAQDADATAEEIAAITEPEVKLTFMAEGVVIQ